MAISNGGGTITSSSCLRLHDVADTSKKQELRPARHDRPTTAPNKRAVVSLNRKHSRDVNKAIKISKIRGSNGVLSSATIGGSALDAAAMNNSKLPIKN